MRLGARLGPVRSGLAVVAALSWVSVATAQQSPSAAAGQVVGEVARCAGAVEVPAVQVAVGVEGGGSNLARTDSNGEFSISLVPGQYTVIATADDGSSASRLYVPVAAGETLDIGILDLGAGVTGCVPDSSAAVAQPSPTVTPTTPPLLPTITPTPPQPAATPGAATGTDNSAPDVASTPTDDTSGG